MGKENRIVLYRHDVKNIINESVKRILMEDNEKSFLAIGFATKFYTLWEIIERIERTEYGVYEKTLHRFIKNVSTDLDRAKEKHPDAVFVPGLRGHTSFYTTKCLQTFGDDEFRGGKYAGQKIEDCTDIPFLYWAWDKSNVVPWGAREIAISTLEKAGYKQINDYKIVTPEEYAKIEASFGNCEEMAAKFTEGPVTIFAPRNLDEEGHLSVGNNTILKFPHYNQMEYQGYYYALPVDAKGKAKRIKGKELSIIADSCEVETSEYGWGATLYVVVKDFAVLK